MSISPVSTKIHSNDLERLGHKIFWAGRPKPARYKTDITLKPHDGTTILSSTSSRGPITKNLGGENIAYNNQASALGCDHRNIILDFLSLRQNVQDHLRCEVCNGKKVESGLGVFFNYTERNKSSSKKEILWRYQLTLKPAPLLQRHITRLVLYSLSDANVIMGTNGNQNHTALSE